MDNMEHREKNIGIESFLLNEYDSLRKESIHNDNLRALMIRFFIFIIIAIFGILRLLTNKTLPKSIETSLLILADIFGVIVLVFHALERSKNIENKYTIDVIRNYFWETYDNRIKKLELYYLPQKPPKLNEVNFWSWGTDFIYSIAISIINIFLLYLTLICSINIRIIYILFVSLLWGVATFYYGYCFILKYKQKKLVDHIADSIVDPKNGTVC